MIESATGTLTLGSTANILTSDVEERLTSHGKIAFLIALSLALSSIPSLRPNLMGLSVHPYLVVLCLAFLHLLRFKDRKDATRGMGGFGMLFILGMTVSVLLGSDLAAGMRILVKWLVSGFTFLVFERLMVSRKDCQFAAIGLISAVVFISWRGLWLYRLNPTYYMEMLPGIGSRNAFSLWTLAPMTFALLFLAMRGTSWIRRLVLLLAFSSMAVPQILSLSRSGWVLLVIIVAMVFFTQRSFKMVVIAALTFYVLVLSIEIIGFEEKVDARFSDLQQGTDSDNLRQFLIIRGVELFLENPIAGVSPQELPYFMRKDSFSRKLSSHNLYIDILAGSGLIGVIPFFLVIGVLVRRWIAGRKYLDAGFDEGIPRALPILLVAIGLRAMTANEIIYCPSVLIGMAIGVGYYSRFYKSRYRSPNAGGLL